MVHVNVTWRYGASAESNTDNVSGKSNYSRIEISERKLHAALLNFDSQTYKARLKGPDKDMIKGTQA